jgi:hypothetical protein
MPRTKQTKKVFLPTGGGGFRLPTRTNRRTNSTHTTHPSQSNLGANSTNTDSEIEDKSNFSGGESSDNEMDRSECSGSDSSTQSAVVAEAVECDSTAEQTNLHGNGCETNQVASALLASEQNATMITVNYSGMQTRKGQMSKTGDLEKYTINILPSMSIEDLTTSIFSHVKRYPDLSPYKLILHLGDDDSNPIDTNSKATVGELHLVHQGFYRVHLVLRDQPEVRITATEAKRRHDQQIEAKKRRVEEEMKRMEEEMMQAIYPSKPKKRISATEAKQIHEQQIEKKKQKCSDSKLQKNTKPAKPSKKLATVSNPSKTKGVTPKAKQDTSKKEKRRNSDTKHGSIKKGGHQKKDKNNNPHFTGLGRRLVDGQYVGQPLRVNKETAMAMLFQVEKFRGKEMTTFKDIQDRFRDELVAENKGASRLMTLVNGDFKIKRLNDTGNAGVLGGEMARSAGKVFQVSWYCNIENKEMTETFEKTKKKLLPASFKIAAYYLRSINEQPRMDTLIRFFPELVWQAVHNKLLEDKLQIGQPINDLDSLINDTMYTEEFHASSKRLRKLSEKGAENLRQDMEDKGYFEADIHKFEQAMKTHNIERAVEGLLNGMELIDIKLDDLEPDYSGQNTVFVTSVMCKEGVTKEDNQVMEEDDNQKEENMVLDNSVEDLEKNRGEEINGLLMEIINHNPIVYDTLRSTNTHSPLDFYRVWCKLPSSLFLAFIKQHDPRCCVDETMIECWFKKAEEVLTANPWLDQYCIGLGQKEC